ncbi:MAG: ATP-dependent DNA helicase RecG [Planctomycetaceae bacterium]|nr:ATP-dependent DNA helicase RecG [Planctomycetaceae bacterium]
MDTTSEKSPAEQMLTPAQFLKGVGPQRAKLLERLGLKTSRDLLFNFPRSYLNMSELRTIDQLRENEPASICGEVDEIELKNTGPGRSMLGVLVRQQSQFLRAVWFNQPFMRDRFATGERVLLSGKAKLNAFRWEMVHPRVEVLADDEDPPSGKILPVYSLTEGIAQGAMRRLMSAVVATHANFVEEIFDDSVLSEKQLLLIADALQQIHEPTTEELLAEARRRFIYQELLMMQLALRLRREKLTAERKATALPVTPKIDARIRRLFPFELTGDQGNAIRDISEDLGRDVPMNRLLQGDVGSGKTVVAEYAMLAAVANQHQAALMAPTEILARQHIETLNQDLQQGRVRIALLTGSLSTAERREALQGIADGEVDLVVGTHAIVQEDVIFKQLGLVIIDEQHRFGVRQRAALRQSGLDPHYLVMTATPIPRTISMTLFGDLDVSTLRQMPPGRQPVHTYLGEESQRGKWWEFFRKKLREGRQGFVIAPLVNALAKQDVESVESTYENLSNGELEAFRLGVVHGRQSSSEKDSVMRDFKEGIIQVLIATSVVEVGINVPNATVMTIEGGQRFGLAQLHQLRGRISRGSHPSYVCVYASTESEEATERLQAFAASTDGFELADRDMQMRGPGDLFSFKQQGLPPLRIADLVRDEDIVNEARSDAIRLIKQAPGLLSAEYETLRERVLLRYGSAMELGDVG